MILDSNFLEFIEYLNKEGAKYVLIGGYAVVINGHSRSTGDIDIFIKIDNDNVEKVLMAIDDFGFGSIGFTAEDLTDEGSIVQMGVPPLRIDILNAIDGVTFDEAYKMAIEYEEEGVKMKVMHINHLIQNKEASGRDKDRDDAAALKKIIKKGK